MSFLAVKWALAQTQIKDTKEAMLLVALADFYNDKTKQCNPSRRALRIKARISNDNTLTSRLYSLKGRGLIEFTVKSGCSNSYTLYIAENPPPESDTCFTDEVPTYFTREAPPTSAVKVAPTSPVKHEPIIEPINEPIKINIEPSKEKKAELLSKTEKPKNEKQKKENPSSSKTSSLKTFLESKKIPENQWAIFCKDKTPQAIASAKKRLANSVPYPIEVFGAENGWAWCEWISKRNGGSVSARSAELLINAIEKVNGVPGAILMSLALSGWQSFQVKYAEGLPPSCFKGNVKKGDFPYEPAEGFAQNSFDNPDFYDEHGNAKL